MSFYNVIHFLVFWTTLAQKLWLKYRWGDKNRYSCYATNYYLLELSNRNKPSRHLPVQIQQKKC